MDRFRIVWRQATSSPLRVGILSVAAVLAVVLGVWVSGALNGLRDSGSGSLSSATEAATPSPTETPTPTPSPSPSPSAMSTEAPSHSPSPTPTPSPSPAPPALDIAELIDRGSNLGSVEWLPDQPSLEGAILNDIVLFGSRLVTVGNDGGASGEPRWAAAWTSADGRAWERASLPGADDEPFPTFVGLPGAGGLVAVATDGEELVAVGGAGTGYGPEMRAVVWTSEDGANWKLEADDPSFEGSFMLDVAAFDGGWVAVGVRESVDGDQSGAIWYSATGHEWRQVNAQLTGAATVVAALDARLVLLASEPNPGCRNCIIGGPHVFISDDGLSWTQVPDNSLPNDFGALDLERVGDGLVTVGHAVIQYDLPVGDTLFETRDGERWQEITALPVGNLGVRKLIASPRGVFLAGSLVPYPGCCSYPAFWEWDAGTWNPVLPSRQITEGSVDVRGAALAPSGSIVAIGLYEAGFADGTCCVIRGVVAIASPAVR